MITNGNKCHKEVQGALTANDPGAWRNPDRKGKLSQGSDLSAETRRIRRGWRVGRGRQQEGKDRETEGRRKSLLKHLRRGET